MLDPKAKHSAPLIGAQPSTVIEDCIAYWSEPEQLKHFEDYIAQKPRRLGHYAEYLIAYWLEHMQGLPTHRNQQINVEGRSIGEFDLLFTQDQQAYWWEIAVKFYCYTDQRNGMSAWVGPNSKDNLQRKYEHLFDKQLQLNQNPDAQHFLESINHGNSKAHAFFKGFVFEPLLDQTALETHINPDCPRGWHLPIKYIDEIPQLKSSTRFLRAPRQEWLAPVMRPPKTDGLKSHQQIINQIKQDQQHDTHMIIELLPDHDGWWVEQRRGFILPDSWPDETRTRTNN